MIEMAIDQSGVAKDRVEQVRRTYERSRLVEMGGIAIAGLGLYHAGGHVIHGAALRGSGGDYLVDDSRYLLEIAGRSSRRDFRTAWRQKWKRLLRVSGGDFFVLVAEFETLTGLLAFKD
jgi:hypothetical protein